MWLKKKTKNEAAAIKSRESKLFKYFADLQLLDSPNEVGLSSVPPEIVIAGSLEILKDLEILMDM